MFKLIKRVFSGQSEPRQVPTITGEDDIPRYPPFAKGLPAADTSRILDTQSELISRIRGILRFTPEDFEQTVRPVIENYAAYVHLLPASEAHHHRGAGGLFRHGLEVGFWAAQQAEAHQFCNDETPRNKRDNEPRWQFAAFLGGLLHDIGKPLSDVDVTNKDGTKEWNPYESSLATWIRDEGVEHYFLRWCDKRNKRHKRFTTLNFDQIMTPRVKAYLNKPGKMIMASLLESIAGTSAQETLTQLVMWADQESVRRDLVNQRMDVDEFAYGVPVEKFVFDALRRLATISKINEPGAMIWRTEYGIFLAWKSIVTEIHNLIEKDKIPGIPRNHDTLADILIERGFAIPYQESPESKPARYWTVYPEALSGVRLSCLRIDDIELIFTNEPPAPAKAYLNKLPEDHGSQSGSNVIPINKHEEEMVDSIAESTEQPDRDIVEEYMRSEVIENRREAKYEMSHRHKEDTTEPVRILEEPKSEKQDPQKASISKLSAIADSVEKSVGEITPKPNVTNKEPNKSEEEKPACNLKPDKNSNKASKNKTDADKEEVIPPKDVELIKNKAPDKPSWALIDLAIAKTLSGKKSPVLVKLEDGDYAIPYPNSARQLGEPRDVMNSLSEDGLLRTALIGSTKTTTINGNKYLVIDSQATSYIDGKLVGHTSRPHNNNKSKSKPGKTKNNKKIQPNADVDLKLFTKEFASQLVKGFGPLIVGDVTTVVKDDVTLHRVKRAQTLEKIQEHYGVRAPKNFEIALKNDKGFKINAAIIEYREGSNEE